MQLTATTFDNKVMKHMHVMAKPIGAKCNINCDYCYYLSKEDLLEYKPGCSPQMSDETLELFIKQYFEAQNCQQVNFSWQGGEPTLLGIGYFEKIIRLQQKYRPEGVEVLNDLQTNGILLDDKWCRFLAKHKFLIGISIDGDELTHNAYRKSKAGKGTWRQVMRAIALLKKYHINFCTLTCVNNITSKQPIETYRFLRDVVQSPMIQFIPIVEQRSFRTQAPSLGQVKVGAAQLNPSHPQSIVESWCTSAEDWGSFLIAIFDEWLVQDVGQVFVQYFEAMFATWMGEQNPLCTLGEICGKGLAMEPNGDVFVCDHYVYPEFNTGNIHTANLENLAFSADQQDFGFAKSKSLNDQCHQCDYKFACFGECPKNRFISSLDGEPGLNYLCQGWHIFFAHADPHLANLLQQNELTVKHGKHQSKPFNQCNFKF